MARKQIDCYGFDATSEFFGIKKLESYLIRKAPDGSVYSCFREEPKRPIHRIDEAPDGSTRIMWAFGKWSEAENLQYVPINETIIIES